MNERMMGERLGEAGTEQVAKAPSFPVYGVAAWEGPRWLESVGGDVPSEVWLGHVTQEGREGVLVGTMHHASRDLEDPAAHTDVLKASALEASGRFLNAGSLDPQVLSVQAEDAEKIRRHVEDQARRVAAWPRVPWSVAGVQVQAAVWRFAGGWIAVCDAVRDAPVVGVGVAADPVGLRLEVVDGASYGVDFATPTTLADLQRRTPEMTMPRPTGDQPHPDVQALIATL